MAMLRISDPRYVRLFKPDLRTSFGNSLKHRPGAILGHDHRVQSRYWRQHHDLIRGGSTTQGLKNPRRRAGSKFAASVEKFSADGMSAEALESVRSQIRHESRDNAMEFFLGSGMQSKMDFDGFARFVSRRVGHAASQFRDRWSSTLEHWFALLDHDG